MTVMRSLLVLLLSLGLAACDSGRKPEQSQQPSAAAAQPEPAVPASVTLASPQPSSEEPAVSPPVPRPAPPARRESRAVPVPHSKAVVRRRPAAPVEAPTEMTAAPLDLSLPRELAEGFGLPSGASAPAGERPVLLPPLFESKDKAAPSSFELGGRLITNERRTTGKDYWESVEGAELQLHFRR